jgi:hypothetical protein
MAWDLPLEHMTNKTSILMTIMKKTTVTSNLRSNTKKQVSVPLSSLTNPFTPTSRHKLLDEQLNQEMKSLYDQMELFPELKTQTKQEDASKKDQESQLHDYSNLSILSRPRRKAPSLEA